MNRAAATPNNPARTIAAARLAPPNADPSPSASTRHPLPKGEVIRTFASLTALCGARPLAAFQIADLLLERPCARKAHATDQSFRGDFPRSAFVARARD